MKTEIYLCTLTYYVNVGVNEEVIKKQTIKIN